MGITPDDPEGLQGTVFVSGIDGRWVGDTRHGASKHGSTRM